MPSVASSAAIHAPHHDLARPHLAAVPDRKGGSSHRVTPTEEINKQYDLFYSNFQLVETAYVQSLSETSAGTVPVSTTLTANYTAGSVTMQVANAGVFGPSGTFASPVYATAMVGSVDVGTFTLTGSSGNLVAVNTTRSSAVNLNTGTTLNATVTTSSATSAQSIFPTYITTSTQQLATNLVAYFNSLPIKLPRMYAPPHQPQKSGAIQQYVYQLVAGDGPNSLERMLSDVSLPQTPASDLQIYNATIETAIEANRSAMLSGVQQIFSGKLQVVPTSASSSSSTSSSGSTAGTGSTSTGTTAT